MKPTLLLSRARRALCMALLSAVWLGTRWSPAQTAPLPQWEGAKVKLQVVDAAPYKINTPLALAISVTRNGCRVAKVEGDRQLGFMVRIEGKAGKRYHEIAAATPVFSADGSSVAYAARNGLDWLWVINGVEGPTFPMLTPTSFAFSEDGKHHAYVAIPDDRLTVLMADGSPKVGSGWDEVMPANMMPQFSRDGSRLAFVEVMKAGNKMRVNLDDQPGPWHDTIAMVPSSGFGAYTNTLANGKVIANARQRPLVPSLNFSTDGKQFAYRARMDKQWHQIINGKPASGHDALGVDFVFSPDGSRHAYAARNGSSRQIVLGFDDSIPARAINDRTLTFSPDSKHFAFAGILGNKLGVWLDEELVPSDITIEQCLNKGSIHFSPDSKRLAYIIRGEDGRLRWVVDGKAGPSTKIGLGQFDFSPDSKHFAYVIPRSTDYAIVVDGKVRAAYAVIPAGPVFRHDGTLEFLAMEHDSLRRFQVTGY